jgi:predicted esterase
MVIRISVLLVLAFLRAPQDEEIWKALDEGNAQKLGEAAGGDTKAALEALKKGRIKEPAPGETKDKVSDISGETDLWIVAPPKYDRSKPAGVLLLLHGMGGTGTQLKDAWTAYAAANNLFIAAPSAQKLPADKANEDGAGGNFGKENHWWSYREGGAPLATLSLLKKRFGIDEDRVILVGYSIGGFGAWNIGLRYPDRFAAIVSCAGGFSRAEIQSLKVDDRMRKLHLNSFNLPIYFVHGDADKTVPVDLARESRNQLKKLGYEHEYKEIPKAAHNLNLKEGGEIMNGIQKWLKDRVRKPHPKEVKHHAIGDYCAQSYWVKITGFKDPAPEVKASVTGQTIDFTATGAKQITFYIDETLLDLEKPIKVKSGGAILFDGEAKPTFDVILETWKGREDRELLYCAKIVVDIK